MERCAGRRGLLTIEYNAIFAHEDAVMATVHCAACNMKPESAPADGGSAYASESKIESRVSRLLGDFREDIRRLTPPDGRRAIPSDGRQPTTPIGRHLTAPDGGARDARSPQYGTGFGLAIS